MDTAATSSEVITTMTDQAHFNIGGTRFSTTWSTLLKMPNSRLGRLYDGVKGTEREHVEFFFDRNPAVFGCILDFYRTGVLHLPETVCGRQIREELGFWEISAGLVSSCCWRVLYKGDSVNKTMTFLDTELPVFPNGMQLIHKGGKTSETIWNLLEHPSSSLMAKGYILFYFVCVVLSVIPDLMGVGILHVINMVNMVFLVDVLMRFIVSPNKIRFIFSIINILDVIALLACAVTLVVSLVHVIFGITLPSIIIQVFGVFQMLKCVRFFRVLKVNRALSILQLAVFKSKRALLMYVSIMMVNCVFCAIIFHWFETSGENGQNVSISESIYWALISMTTIGYGDIYPVTAGGRVMGVLCGISGLVLLTIPISAIYHNYKTLNYHNNDRENHAIDLDRYRETPKVFDK
ncbi:potassium voltage-gated channel protein Shaw-like [Argopecten irradians]|uniref:potassium voltage-gated channel protein Shaw-like n=1 Tax=Argopecten irradians TaxID=31199 RepID=UPI00371EBEC1